MERARGVAILVLLAALIAAAFSITGCGSGEATGDSAEEDLELAFGTVEHDVLHQYRVYLVREAGALLVRSKQLDEQVTAGEEFNAQAEYESGRIHYGHLQPAAGFLPTLDERIAGDSESESGSSGFEALERGLFESRKLADAVPAAHAFPTDVEKLRDALVNVKLEPARLAQADVALLGRVIHRQVMQRAEEPLAGIDLVDASASVEGAEQAFHSFRPHLERLNPDLTRMLEARFAEAFEMFAKHGRPARWARTPEPAEGSFFVPDQDLEVAELEPIAEPLEDLQAVLREAAKELAKG